MELTDQIKQAAAYIQNKKISEPQIGIILGTGIGKLGDKIQADVIINYEEIPHFPLSTIEFHSGKLIYGNLGGKKVIALQGRFHAYEGYTMQQITFPVRVLKQLGVRELIITNAAGSMNPAMKKGELMVIEDHINLQPGNPLAGKNYNELGSRFPDMSKPYNHSMIQKLSDIAAHMNLTLHKGVYVSVQGPNLETKAEYRYLRMIGADVVGMSTVPEVIVANHSSLPVAAISVITDECDPENLKPVSIADIIETAGKAEVFLTSLIYKYIEEVNF
ncbi:MAG: purine-nucleoside phosphorylase [Chitinophagales bacterium]|nr:purine-nucleoside phosphorylase [Chitinophagales bacterium]